MQSHSLKLITIPLFFINFLISTNLFAADPPIISVSSITSSSIELSWSAADRGRITYSIYRYDGGECLENETVAGTTNRKDFVVSGLAANTMYSFIIAADTRSGPTASLCSGPVTTELGGGNPPGDCNYPAFSDPPGSGTNADFVQPAWLANSPALVFDDNFDGVDDESWIDELMIDALNRSGNSGISADGSVCLLNTNPYCAPEGKRWSAWYNENLDSNRNRNIVDGILEMGGTADLIPDLTRPGAGEPWENNRLSTAFITTWARSFDIAANAYVESPAIVKVKLNGPTRCTSKPVSALI